MVSVEHDWHSNPLRVVALLTDTTCEQRAMDVMCLHPLSGTDMLWTLMRQNQLMQEENRALRKKMRSLQDENVWASSELDRMHWEHQNAMVELQWLASVRAQPTTAVLAVASSPPPPVAVDPPAKTYAQTLQTEDAGNKSDGAMSGERCLRHEPAARREKRQCKCCVLEAIYRLVLSAPKDTPDVGEYVASCLASTPPFVSFWCPGCTRDFVNQTPRRDLESILRLVERIERDAAPMAELKPRLKPLALRQRVKCAAHCCKA